MKYSFFPVILLFPLLLMAQRKTNLDQDWKFFLGDGNTALNNPEVTHSWRTLDLPHDWSVETEAAKRAGGKVIGPFSTNSVGGYQTGFTVGGEGWYYKLLKVDSLKFKDSSYSLYFEGAYNQTEVYLNGQKLYFNPYGYIGFRVDLTNVLHEGDNSLLVRVMNEGNNSRWYAGSGIYRHVWLIQTSKNAYFDEWDYHVTTEDNNDGTWLLTVDAPFKTLNKAVLQHTLYDSTGKKVVAVKGSQARQTVKVKHPVTWSPDRPCLYRLETRLLVKGEAKDNLSTHVGFRSLSFSATDGFKLNGQSVLLRGGCVHHDHGLLGAAAYDRAEERKLELLKAQGFNAVRTSHGLPSEHFLDVCDSLGLMVVDETFDQWLIEKNHEDYHRFFVEHSTHDLQTMIRRDRNHPSVIMWGIGNEIPGRIEPAGMATAERLRQTICDLDTTRPVTAAICGWDAGDAWNAGGQNWDQQDAKAFQSLDVGGYNYLYFRYEHDHGTHPDRVICGLESFPKQLSQNWDLVEKKPYVIGDFVWTAMDYLGEAGIGSASYRKEGNQSMFQGWPWYNGWCGDIDIIGQKKPQSYYRDVVWRRSPVTMAVERPAPAGTRQSISAWGWQLEEQCWTFPDMEGQTMSINVYSRAPKVRLYLNGESLGDKQPGETYWTAYQAVYHPGTLRVVNLNAQGEEMPGEEFVLQTTGKPAALRLNADRDTIKANRSDLCYVTIELVDAEGRVCTSNSDLHVQLSVEGEGGCLLASGNASPNDMASFRSTNPSLFRGRALAILRSSDTPGIIRLNVRADGIASGTQTVRTVNIDNE